MGRHDGRPADFGSLFGLFGAGQVRGRQAGGAGDSGPGRQPGHPAGTPRSGPGGSPGQHRGQVPGHGPGGQGPLQGGRHGEPGAAPVHHRPAALRGGTEGGRGQAGPGPGPGPKGRERPQALRRAARPADGERLTVRAVLHRGAGAAGHGGRRPGRRGQRPAATQLLLHQGSGERGDRQPAPGRGQPGQGQRRKAHGHHPAGAAHLREFRGARKIPGPDHGAAPQPGPWRSRRWCPARRSIRSGAS